jgi:glycerol-3-phosphate acyltransferase PlsY
MLKYLNRKRWKEVLVMPEAVLGCCVIGYLLGNINPAFLFARLKGYDPRVDGSGNAGASNAFILAGKTAFFATAILDILKAFLACRLCRYLFPALPVAEQIGGAA